MSRDRRTNRSGPLRAQPRRLTLVGVGLFLALDTNFGLLVGSAFLNLIGNDLRGIWARLGQVMLICYAISAVWLAVLARLLLPFERWMAADEASRQASLTSVIRHAQRLPNMIGLFWDLRWMTYALVLTLTYGSPSAWATFFFLATMILGPWPLAHSFAHWLQTPLVRQLSLRARSAGSESESQPRRLASQMAAYCACLAIAPGTYVASLAFSAIVHGVSIGDLASGVMVFFGAVFTYAFICAVLLAATVTGPVVRMRHVLESITNQGAARRVDRIPNERVDEIGELTKSANRMIDQLETTESEREAYRLSLEELNRSLECRVEERTRELEESMAALQKAQQQLVDTARCAGMAEVATGILHNVGNVINGVNISAGLVRREIDKSAVSVLDRLLALLDEHNADPEALHQFLVDDPRGRRFPEALTAVAKRLRKEKESARAELDNLLEKVRHVIAIVASQQQYARTSTVQQEVELSAFLDTALTLAGPAFSDRHVRIVRQYADLPGLKVDSHKLMQVVVNLLSNARHAVADNDPNDRAIVLSTRRRGADGVVISVADNGVGIPAENVPRLFVHGFTTKPDGHGFGLHISAIAIDEIGGRLTAQSDGLGHGATFEIELPLAEAAAVAPTQPVAQATLSRAQSGVTSA